MFLSNDKIYCGVDKYHLSGCSGCRNRERFLKAHFCLECIKKMKETEVKNAALNKTLEDEALNFCTDIEQKCFSVSESSSDVMYPCNHGKYQVFVDYFLFFCWSIFSLYLSFLVCWLVFSFFWKLPDLIMPELKLSLWNEFEISLGMSFFDKLGRFQD